MTRLGTQPQVFGLFEKRLAGDDALMRLAQLRFQLAGLGAEVHAGTATDFDWVMQFNPSTVPVVVHLPRSFDLVDEADRERILRLAEHVVGGVYGFVIHDHHSMVSRRADYLHAAQEMDARLGAVPQAPLLFIEYAAGLEPDFFAGFFHSIRQLTQLSACIDVGHVGIRTIRRTFAANHPNDDICALKNSRSWSSELLEEVQNAVRLALPEVLRLIRTLAALGKPLHFHLHDGHPLSASSPFGVSDHLSFLTQVPLRTAPGGQRSLPLMFGPAGLEQIASTVLNSLGRKQVSFTLEIHPDFQRLPLGDAAPLFGHWHDKTNAEQMNQWLDILAQNARLLAGFAGET
jgi:hypothetical protein